MSRQAVEALARQWDESANPILHSAAGQLREALRAHPAGSVTCSECGRRGIRGFAKMADGDFLCMNAGACARRCVEQGLT